MMRIFLIPKLSLSLSLFVFLSLCLLPGAAFAQSRAEAFVDQATIRLGQTGNYTIRIENPPGDPNLAPPAVPGLRFSGVSRNTSISIVNARRTQTLELRFSFAGERPGEFVIPGRTFSIGGQEFTVSDVRVTVTEMDESLREIFDLQLILPDRPLYVGERIPATLQLFLRPDVRASLADLPSHQGDAFGVTNLPREPRQGTVTRDGQRFSYAAWDIVVTPLRAGEVSLVYSMPIVYEDRSRVERDFFGRARPMQERITLTTDSTPIVIRRIPTEGRPDSFRDAVGRFDAVARLSHETLQAGDPLTLTLDVTGEGNIDRLSGPSLGAPPGWRIFPPRVQFTPAPEDPHERRGTRTFEYVLIPENESVEFTPGFAFSFFDPEDGEFREFIFEEEPVVVTPAPEAGPAMRDFRAERARASDPAAALRPPRSRTGPRYSDLRPVLHLPGFWGLALTPTLAFALLGWVRRRQQQVAADAVARLARARQRALREALAQAAGAAREEKALPFFEAAQRAWQIALVPWAERNQQPEALTLADILPLLEKAGADDEAHAFARTTFTLAESGKYAGGMLAGRDLSADLASLRRALDSLSPPPAP